MIVTLLKFISESCQSVFVRLMKMRVGASVEVQLNSDADTKKGPGRSSEYS